ncbi:hypothetical protein EON68_03835, partial [archaeon]
MSEKYATETSKMKALIEKAEAIAKSSGYHSTAMMDLGREYWAAEGMLPPEDECEDDGAPATDVGTEAEVEVSAAAPRPAYNPALHGVEESKECEEDAVVTAAVTESVAAAPPVVPAKTTLADVVHEAPSAAVPASSVVPAAAATSDDEKEDAADAVRTTRERSLTIDDATASVNESLRRFNAQQEREREARAAATRAAADERARVVAAANAAWWFPALDAALRKFVPQSSFDFEKVAKALRVAVSKGVLRAPAGRDADAAAIVLELTAAACRERFATLSLGAAAASTAEVASPQLHDERARGTPGAPSVIASLAAASSKSDVSCESATDADDGVRARQV